MKLKSILMATAAAGVLALPAFAEGDMSLAEAPCENCADELTVVSWGGAYQNSQIKAYSEPYAEATGVTFVWDESSAEAVAKLRAMSEAGNVTWDVVDVVASDAIRLCDEGLAIEIDGATELAPAPDGTSADDDFGVLRVNDCFVPQIVYSTTFGYRTDVAEWNGAVPDDICDIFDLETFPGKRSLQRRPIDNMEWATYCNGTPKDEIYDVLSTDEGIAAALAKLDTIKDQVVWWTAGAETPQLLADGEVVMGSTFNGRLFSAIAEQDQPIAMMWDMQSFDLDGWIIPEGLDEARLNRAKHFLKFATDTQRLADQAKYISYGPARASSAPLVGTHAELGIDMAPHMPTDPANAANVHNYDYTWWADNRDDIDAKFQAWLVQ
ncbi:MAG: extracellular solute-binding protein [Roseitalea sp.]|jgi:putative spermidine/putrescine transport system substrate-binding protein|nr:extracellular solute-binding protein [Oceaniradius stylonematis]MBO6551736.1 extracellular solute-binding protein [Roseitalea sp.]MBO6951884.1 extracellular solute-binding protein [Rhizobiaceae bacterium]RNC95690.1 MAG: extracellular solute-binding protein [Oricola sp.]MBO6592270.1 extracellular solute-binding protein [Roseitalea sp.]MBO6598525.1 extracellular solute-binding protein [Roseitalea sp.]